MKNKNGFTLVELLAVIAILAILVVVAMPNVLGMFNEAKQNTFVTEVQKYMDTAKAQFFLPQAVQRQFHPACPSQRPYRIPGAHAGSSRISNHCGIPQFPIQKQRKGCGMQFLLFEA